MCRFRRTRSGILGPFGNPVSVPAAMRFERRCNGDRSPHAGFSTTRPWLPLADNWTGQNVASLDLQPFSILSLYKRLLALRRRYEALRIGRYETLTCRGDVFGFARSVGQEKLIVLLNFGHERRTVSLGSERATALLSTVRDRSGERVAPELALDPNEAVILAEEN